MPESCPAWLATGLSAIHPCDRPPKDCPDSHHWRHFISMAIAKLFRYCILRWTSNCCAGTQSGFMLERRTGLMSNSEGAGNVVAIHPLDPEDAAVIAQIR